MLHLNRKSTPYPKGEEYHPLTEENKKQLDTKEKYMQLISDLRYIADSTRPDISYVAGRLGTAMESRTVRHLCMVKASIRYLQHTRNFGLHFHKRPQAQNVGAAFKTRSINASYDDDWANEKTDSR